MAEKHSNAAEFTVFEISNALRKTIEDNFGNVRVRGEISGFRGVHASGHAYFALKDDKARLEAVIWRNTLQGLKFSPEEGLEVIAGGRLSSYLGSSKYQIIIDSLEPAGAGALMALLEARRKKLAAAGFFDEARKKPLPFMPRIIGVITSPTGAVIRDIIHRIADRFPLHILVWPVRVQGETAAAETIAAIRGFNALPESRKEQAEKSALIPRPDLLIIARGGGSLEDLWSFNDEDLVRAAAQSELPIISAIGHETDWTLLDYTADRRAPTPTGAAEIAVPVKAELQAGIANLEMRLYHASRRFITQKRQIFSGLTRAFPSADKLFADPRRHFDDITARLKQALIQMLRQKRTNYDALAGRAALHLITRLFAEKRKHYRQIADRVTRAFNQNTTQHRQKLAVLDRLLKTVSYQNILERGFTLVIDEKHQLIRRAKEIAPKQNFTLRFADGTVNATANAINSHSDLGSISALLVQTSSQSKIMRPKKTTSLPNSDAEICLKKDTKEREPAKKPRQGNLF